MSCVLRLPYYANILCQVLRTSISIGSLPYCLNGDCSDIWPPATGPWSAPGKLVLCYWDPNPSSSGHNMFSGIQLSGVLHNNSKQITKSHDPKYWHDQLHKLFNIDRRGYLKSTQNSHVARNAWNQLNRSKNPCAISRSTSPCRT